MSFHQTSVPARALQARYMIITGVGYVFGVNVPESMAKALVKS